MKKTISALLVIVLIFALSLPALAATSFSASNVEFQGKSSWFISTEQDRLVTYLVTAKNSDLKVTGTETGLKIVNNANCNVSVTLQIALHDWLLTSKDQAAKDLRANSELVKAYNNGQQITMTVGNKTVTFTKSDKASAKSFPATTYTFKPGNVLNVKISIGDDCGTDSKPNSTQAKQSKVEFQGDSSWFISTAQSRLLTYQVSGLTRNMELTGTSSGFKVANLGDASVKLTINVSLHDWLLTSKDQAAKDLRANSELVKAYNNGETIYIAIGGTEYAFSKNSKIKGLENITIDLGVNRVVSVKVYTA